MSRSTYRRGSSRLNELLVLVSISLCLLLSPGVGAQRKARPTPTPSPLPPTQPTVEFQAFPAQENLKRGETIAVTLEVNNKSNLTLNNLNLKVRAVAFEVATPPSFQTLPPFGHSSSTVLLKAKSDAPYAKHSVPLTLEYTWEGNGKQIPSALPANVAIEVKRPFEEFTGLPGGPALFLLLLPIIPAFLGYQLFDRWRKGEGFNLPTFKPEYILPAFFVAFLGNGIVIGITRSVGVSIDYTKVRDLAVVLLASFGVGVLIPLSRSVRERVRKGRWGFTRNETMLSYLRKALMSPHTPERTEWVEGIANGEEWAGIFLKQPDGSQVLGARLQVSYPRKVSNEAWERFLAEVISLDGTVINPERLFTMIETNELVLGFAARVTRNDERLDPVVVIGEFEDWKGAGGKTSPLINPSR